MTAKVPLKVHLRLRFQNLGKPRTAGLCGRAAGACDCGPLSCTKIERPPPPRKPSCKVRLFAQNRSLKYRPKVTSQRCLQPFLIPIFNFSHKCLTFALTPESGHTLAFRRKIAHIGSHAETGAFPSAGTAWLCAANRIALNAAFATPDSTVLLYTYISRFSVNPHYQQTRKIRQSYRRNSVSNRFSSHLSTSPTNGSRSLSRAKVGIHSALLKGSHTSAYTSKQGRFGRGAIITLGVLRTFANLPGSGIRTAYVAAFGSWSGALPKNAESLRSSDALMCVAAPRRRGPTGLRDPVVRLLMLRFSVSVRKASE